MSMDGILAQLRAEIDEVDAALLPLYERRMEAVRQVAELKRENNLSILDAGREQVIIDKMADRADAAYRAEISLLTRTMLALSKSYQRKRLFPGEETLLPPPAQPKRENVVCVYQGVPGAWSEQALLQVFPDASYEAAEYFEDVFRTVKEEKADYGVVPVENSRTGAIGETYDLLRRYGCYIVGRVSVEIRQCLLAPEGVGLNDIRRVLSHPEALRQCGKYLKKHPWEQIACSNTAVAAESVAKENDGHSAAVGSRRAAERSGLSVLVPDIMDSAGNTTAFVVIARAPEYTADSTMITVTFSTAHRSGALCEALMPYMACGLNLARIESRPGTGGDYRFFADIESNILDPAAQDALRQAAAACEYFEVLGCYDNLE